MTFIERKAVISETFSTRVCATVAVASLLGILATFIRWWGISGADTGQTFSYDHGYGAAQMTYPLALGYGGIFILAALSFRRHEPIKGMFSAPLAVLVLLSTIVGYFVSIIGADSAFRRTTSQTVVLATPSQGMFLSLVCSIVLTGLCIRDAKRQRS